MSTSNNADVNGAYNILRKVVPKAFAEGIEGVGLHPERIELFALKQMNHLTHLL